MADPVTAELKNTAMEQKNGNARNENTLTTASMRMPKPNTTKAYDDWFAAQARSRERVF